MPDPANQSPADADAEAAPPDALAAPAAPVEVDERWSGDPNRYTDVEGTVDRSGEVTVEVGEFAGSIVDVKVKTSSGLVDVDSGAWSVGEIGVGLARVTVKSKALTSGAATVRLVIPAD